MLAPREDYALPDEIRQYETISRALESSTRCSRILLAGALLQFPGGDGELHDVGGDAGRVGAGGELGAAAGEGLQLPVVERGPLHRHVVARVAVLAVGKNLDDLRAGQFVGDGGEVQRVAARWVIARERERTDG